MKEKYDLTLKELTRKYIECELYCTQYKEYKKLRELLEYDNNPFLKEKKEVLEQYLLKKEIKQITDERKIKCKL